MQLFSLSQIGCFILFNKKSRFAWGWGWDGLYSVVGQLFIGYETYEGKIGGLNPHPCGNPSHAWATVASNSSIIFNWTKNKLNENI